MRARGRIVAWFALSLLWVPGCTKKSESPFQARVLPAAKLTEARYVPDPAIVGTPVSNPSVRLTRKSLRYTEIGMVAFDEPWGSRELTVDLGHHDASEFGPQGSMTLFAETERYPMEGGAYPVLSSFKVIEDGGVETEYVNLSDGCRTGGMWRCTNGSCTANSECTVHAGSAFGGRLDWDQHQVPPFGYATTNSFPRCDSTVNSWDCPFSGGLKTGRYRAKYLLLSNSGSSVTSKLADLRIELFIKTDSRDRNSGAGDRGLGVNLILVGDRNISDSRTDSGARNLNLMFAEVNRIFSKESGAALGLGQIKVYEWADADGGAEFSQVQASRLGDLFESGSKGVGSEGEGERVNLFLVSDIEAGSRGFTVLGLSGGILGPPRNGTQGSGLAFSSFDSLKDFNPNPGCGMLDCPREHQEGDFLEMAATIAHELGHYLGLNHPSEKPDPQNRNHQDQDSLNDTPSCQYRIQTISGVLDQRACYFSDTALQDSPLSGRSCQQECDAVTGGGISSYLRRDPASSLIDSQSSLYSGSAGLNGDMPFSFCPQVKECQFNHVMWYTTKNRRMDSGSWQEDGNLFSPQSSALLQWSPFVR